MQNNFSAYHLITYFIVVCYVVLLAHLSVVLMGFTLPLGVKSIHTWLQCYWEMLISWRIREELLVSNSTATRNKLHACGTPVT